MAGGTFLTKVYRSSDYNALMWVFNQLFHSVQAIKPSSSRQQSAEIFVLCLKYRAPHSIDPKLLDPAYVFQEVGRPARRRRLFTCWCRLMPRFWCVGNQEESHMTFLFCV